MDELRCPQCRSIYSQGMIRCLLCGSELPRTAVIYEPPKKKGKKKSAKSQSMDAPDVPKVEEEIVVEDEVVPPFDDTGGFSEKVSKKDQILAQLQADNEGLRKELTGLEEIYKHEHPKGKAWYASFLTWFTFVLVVGLGYLIYWWVKYEGGIPHEFGDFIRRIF